MEHPEQFITFEEQVHLDHTSFIDGVIPSTAVNQPVLPNGMKMYQAKSSGPGTAGSQQKRRKLRKEGTRT